MIDFSKEIDTEAVGSVPVKISDPSVPDEMDVVLVRSAEPDASSAGGSFGSLDIGDMIADGMDELAKKSSDIGRAAPSSQGGGNTFQIDTLTATAAAVFYTDVILPGVVGAIGEAIGGEGYKYKSLGKRFEQTYRETVTRLLESGQITLPTPMQCFIAMTLVVVATNAFQIFKERKKRVKKMEKQQPREMFDESQPLPIDDIPGGGGSPIPSDLTVEIAKRKKFQTENGFYTFDLEGVYIKKGDRKYGPSDVAKKAISQTSDNQQIKELIKKARR